ncbi:uncharacterized protein LOC141595373 [Silene latifolia]|uniref:uncharacterized protein LOC141595373 n=1 Tax=Silene latifolia TaxID=37657 RepID=UPI003D78A795
MEGSLIPSISKLVGEVVSKPRRSITSTTEVCLEDWWLSKPKNEEGIAVSGRPSEIRNFNLASPAGRHASREFHSTKVVKRHEATMLETCDGILISLCGFINKSRTQENGFTSEVCRDFICGFPFNWDDNTAQSADEELKSNKNFIESFTPGVLDSLNGAQLHDFMLSLTDTERDLFIERFNNNLKTELGLDTQSSKSSPKSSYSLRSGSSRQSTANEDAKASKKQRLNTSTDVYLEQDLRGRSGATNVDDEHAL